MKPLQFYNTALPGVDCSELQGTLIVIEGPDAVGRSTQVTRLRQWLEQEGHAVLDTGMARSALAAKGIKQAKEGNTLGPVTMTLYYLTDFADRLENEIVPALRAGFVVLTDRYIFSIIARAIARGEDRRWIEQVTGCALIPHAVYYLRAEVKDLVSRVVRGRGAFDYVIFQELQSHIVNHGLQKVGTSLETNGAPVPLDHTGSAAQQKNPKSAPQRKH